MTQEQLQQEFFNRFMKLNILRPKLPTFDELIHKGEEAADHEFANTANLIYSKASSAYKVLATIQTNPNEPLVRDVPNFLKLQTFGIEHKIDPISEELFIRLLAEHLRHNQKDFFESWKQYVKANPNDEFYGHEVELDNLTLDDLLPAHTPKMINN